MTVVSYRVIKRTLIEWHTITAKQIAEIKSKKKKNLEQDKKIRCVMQTLFS